MDTATTFEIDASKEREATQIAPFLGSLHPTDQPRLTAGQRGPKSYRNPGRSETERLMDLLPRALGQAHQRIAKATDAVGGIPKRETDLSIVCRGKLFAHLDPSRPI